MSILLSQNKNIFYKKTIDQLPLSFFPKEHVRTFNFKKIKYHTFSNIKDASPLALSV